MVLVENVGIENRKYEPLDKEKEKVMAYPRIHNTINPCACVYQSIVFASCGIHNEENFESRAIL